MSDENPSPDHGSVDEKSGTNAIEDNLKSGVTWLRGLFMLISCLLISVASFVGTLVVILGFFWVLFSGEVNRQLQQVGQSIASYIYEIIRYLTFNSDERPFPLGGKWPSTEEDAVGVSD